jgi:hypothetical protein
MPKCGTQTGQDAAKAVGDDSVGSATPSLSEIFVRAIEDESPADERRDIRNRLARIEAAVAGDSSGKTADESVKKNTGGRPLDVYVGALVDLIAANVAAFGDAVADTLPTITSAAGRRAVERFLPVLGEAFDARLDERLHERNQQHFAHERPRSPKDWEHALADAMRRRSKKIPPGK